MKSAKEYIGSMLHVYCLNRREFEPNQMSITPSGDMIDDEGRVLSAERHLPFVLYGTAKVAIVMAKEEMKQKAIEAFKENCQRPKDTEPCVCELCVRWVGGHCELLDGFIEKLNL